MTITCHFQFKNCKSFAAYLDFALKVVKRREICVYKKRIIIIIKSKIYELCKNM